MGTVNYRYFLVPLTETGEAFDQSVELDETVFSPSVEWTHFSGIRKNILPAFVSPSGSAIVPRWTRQGGPFINGFDVQILGEDDTVNFSESFPISYFRQHVRCFIYQKTDPASKTLSVFRVCAVPVQNEGACGTAGSSFSLEEIKRPLDLREASFGSLLEASTCTSGSASGTAHEIDMPVFITEEVISEAIQVSRDAGENEAGGILAGYLCRGPEDKKFPEIFILITSQIQAPVEKEDTGKTRIRFSPDTWSYFRKTLINRDEIMIAWWHSHPFMKSMCAEAGRCNRKELCTTVFFSTADVQFHCVAFPQAYSTALVIGDTPCSGLSYGLFGWRKGEIVTRDFYVLKKTASEIEGLIT